MNQAHQFLDLLFGDKDPDACMLIWTMPGKRSAWFQEVAQAAAYVGGLPEGTAVYVGCGLSPKALGQYDRCLADDIVAVPGLWLDLDFADPGAHQKGNLPPSPADALRLLGALEQRPTMVVNSGHGFHAWWLFKEPWTLETPQERQEAASLVRRLQGAVRVAAQERGWTVDATADLARVLRVPGTVNAKDPDNPRPCEFHSLAEDRRYNPMDFDDLPPDPGPAKAKAEKGAVVETAGGLRLSLDAREPRRLPNLLAVDPTFLATWNRTRRFDGGDNSQSSFDMALANICVAADFADQEIADTIIAHRVLHNQFPEKALRKDYIARTIIRARQDKAERESKAGLSDARPLMGSPYETPEHRDSLRDNLSTRLGIKIIKIIRWLGSPSTYQLDTDRGSVHLGTIEHLITQSRFIMHVAEVTGVIIQLKKGEWGPIAQDLRNLAEDDLASPNATDEGKIVDWVSRYLEAHPPRAMEEAERESPITDGGAIFIRLSPLRSWVFRGDMENVTTKELGRLLRLIGAESVQKNIKDNRDGRWRNVHAYRLPSDMGDRVSLFTAQAEEIRQAQLEREQARGALN